MATLGQRSKSGSALYKAGWSEQSNQPVNGRSERSGAFIGPEAQSLSWPLLRYFDDEALKAYVELLQNLSERLRIKAANCDDLSSAIDFSETSEEDLIPGKDIMRGKFISDVYQKAPKIWKNQVLSGSPGFM